MNGVKVTRTATRDLQEIWNYIAADNPDAANKVINAIEAGITKIAEMPGIGHPRADVAATGYRFWKVYSYLIAYRFQGSTLVISRVIHAARDLSRVFKQK
jgi:toxin ParE1/3/4